MRVTERLDYFKFPVIIILAWIWCSAFNALPAILQLVPFSRTPGLPQFSFLEAHSVAAPLPCPQGGEPDSSTNAMPLGGGTP